MACESPFTPSRCNLTKGKSTVEQTGMSFLGIGLGQVIAVATQPLFNRYILSFHVHPTRLN